MGATVHQRTKQALHLLTKAQACLTDIQPAEGTRLKWLWKRAAALTAEANRTLWELIDEASRREGDLPRLHVYGQHDWHRSVKIVGSRAGLKILRNAIDSALVLGSGQAVGLFAGDGDAYDAAVLLEERGDAWDRVAIPYTDELAREQRADAIQPAAGVSGKTRVPIVYLGAETEQALQEVRKLADEACRRAREAGIEDAVNWADLRCVSASVEVDDEGNVRYAVWIEEADQAAVTLQAFVRDWLNKAGFPGVDVRTAW